MARRKLAGHRFFARAFSMESPPTNLELSVFVDAKSEYYLNAWKPALTGTGHVRQFNLSAFFLGALWLVYRKMYPEAMLLLGANLAIGFITALICDVALRDPLLSQGVASVVGIAIGGYVAAHANGWYLSRALRVISRVRGSGLSPDDQIFAIARRGGTNPFAAVVFLVVFVVVIGTCLGGPLQLRFHEDPSYGTALRASRPVDWQTRT
jgi:hypothetical protein